VSALVFDGVKKRFGRSVALDGLSFQVSSGSLCGLVGPNGAGKTTAFSIVCGFLRADAGTIRILDRQGFDPWALKGRLGVLPQDAELGFATPPGSSSPTWLASRGWAGETLRRKPIVCWIWCV